MDGSLILRTNTNMAIELSQVRYYTDSDTYHYSVDNRPIQDLAANMEILKEEIQRITSVSLAHEADSNKTLPEAGVVTLVFVATLSATRFVYLNDANARYGDKARVVRTSAATGGSLLTIVGNGTSMKNLSVSQWAEFEFIETLSGGRWFQTGFGSL